MSLNYGTLKTKILDDGKRPGLTSKVAAWVRYAESVVAGKARFSEMLTRATLTDANRVTANKGIYTTPDGFLDPRIIWRADGTPLTRKGLQQIRSISGSAPPIWFAVLSQSELEFRGVPSTAEAFEVLYFERPTPFVDDADTNALLTNYESIYVNLALSELYKYTEDLELAATVARAALDDIADLNEQASRSFGGAGHQGAYNFCSSGSY